MCVNHGAVGLGDVFSLPVGAVSSQSREITMYSNKEKENFTERQERNSIPIMDSLVKRWGMREKKSRAFWQLLRCCISGA